MKHALAQEACKHEIPSWLDALDLDAFEHQEFPRESFLTSCLFYPACHTDGGPVSYLGGLFHAFMYVDYEFKLDALKALLAENPFRGYHVAAQRMLRPEELGTDELQYAPMLPKSVGRWRLMQMSDQRFFAYWIVLERDQDHAADHGPQRMTLVFICHDGVRTYYELFRQQGLAPKALAIIQPGHGFGGNWCDFNKVGAPLYMAVMFGTHPKPQYLLHGGVGPSRAYPEAPWPEFTMMGDVVKEVRTGSFRIWSRLAAEPEGCVDMRSLDLLERFFNA